MRRHILFINNLTDRSLTFNLGTIQKVFRRNVMANDLIGQSENKRRWFNQ